MRLNSAQMQLKTNAYFAAVENCTKVLNDDENNLKGLYRRGVAYLNLQEFEKSEVNSLLFRMISKKY